MPGRGSAEAEVEYRVALAQAPGDVGLQTGLVRAFLNQQKSSAALALVEEMVKRPATPAAMFVILARLLAERGEIPAAIARYRQGIEQDPSAADPGFEARLGIGAAAVDAAVVEGRARDRGEDEPPTPDVERPPISFADVGGMDELEEEIRLKIIHPLNHPEMYRASGKRIGGGILMDGPPGCAEFDGANASNEGALALAATNSPWHVDPAFRRPGRFDRVLCVPPPDAPAREQILRILCRDKPAAGADMAAVARKTADFSGADLQAVVDQAVEQKLREALRLVPNNDCARLGIVEALKARNLIYRCLLQYFLWVGRLPRRLRWGLVIGGVLGTRALRHLVSANPALIWPVGLLLAAYAIFIVLTWIGDAVFNLLLLLDPVGRHALSDDQRRGAQVFGCVLLLVAGLAVGGFAVRSPAVLMAAILWVLTSLVVPSAWRCERGWPRRGAAAAVSTVAALAAVMTAALLATIWNGTNPRDVFAAGGLKTVAVLFLPVLLGTMILSQITIRVQVRH